MQEIRKSRTRQADLAAQYQTEKTALSTLKERKKPRSRGNRIEEARAREQLRQDRERFDQQTRHADQRVRLDLFRGYFSVLYLPGLIALCYSFAKSSELSPQMIAAIITMVMLAWKVTFGQRGLGWPALVRYLAPMLRSVRLKPEQRDEEPKDE